MPRKLESSAAIADKVDALYGPIPAFALDQLSDFFLITSGLRLENLSREERALSRKSRAFAALMRSAQDSPRNDQAHDLELLWQRAGEPIGKSPDDWRSSGDGSGLFSDEWSDAVWYAHWIDEENIDAGLCVEYTC